MKMPKRKNPKPTKKGEKTQRPTPHAGGFSPEDAAMIRERINLLASGMASTDPAKREGMFATKQTKSGPALVHKGFVFLTAEQMNTAKKRKR